jgi:photosystem II stability/assembly factor-like uncharacterized protein
MKLPRLVAELYKVYPFIKEIVVVVKSKKTAKAALKTFADKGDHGILPGSRPARLQP